MHRAKKLVNLRLFENPENDKPWDKSIKDLNLEILCVSQVGFTARCTFNCMMSVVFDSPLLAVAVYSLPRIER